MLQGCFRGVLRVFQTTAGRHTAVMLRVQVRVTLADLRSDPSASKPHHNAAGIKLEPGPQSLFCVFPIENSARIRGAKLRNASFPVWVIKKSWEQLCRITVTRETIVLGIDPN